ncbi:hypothetical protein PSTT_01330, partial [Puccinia striiformis]
SPGVARAFIFLLAFLQSFEARQIWANDPAFPSHRLQRRRFSQESIPAPLFNIDGCPGQVCGNLGGGSITPLLAMKPPCDQQDYADKVIDAALDKTNGITSEDVRKKLIEVAIKYRLAERNSKPQYWPVVVGRGSLYCQKAPRHPQLKGLVQKQDPANNKTLFFDPAKISINDGTVLLGSQPDTRPFEGTSNPSFNPLTSSWRNKKKPKGKGGGQDQKGLESSGDPAPGSDVTPKDTSTTGTEQNAGPESIRRQWRTTGLEERPENRHIHHWDKSDALKNGQKTDTSNTGDQTDASKNGLKTDTSTGGGNEAKTTGDNGLGGKQTGSSNGQQEQKSLDQTQSQDTPAPGSQLTSTENENKGTEDHNTDTCGTEEESNTDNTKSGGTGSANGQEEKAWILMHIRRHRIRRHKNWQFQWTTRGKEFGSESNRQDSFSRRTTRFYRQPEQGRGGGAKTDSSQTKSGDASKTETQADNTKPGDTGSANQQEQKSVDANGNVGAGGTGSGGTALGGTQTGTSNGQQEEKSLDQTPSDKTPSPGEQQESTDNQAKPGEALKTDSQTDNTKPGDTGSANGQTGGGVQEQKSLDTSGAGNGSGTQTGTDPKDASKEEKTVDSNGSEDNCSANGNEENTESTDPKPTTTTTRHHP